MTGMKFENADHVFQVAVLHFNMHHPTLDFDSWWCIVVSARLLNTNLYINLELVFFPLSPLSWLVRIPSKGLSLESMLQGALTVKTRPEELHPCLLGRRNPEGLAKSEMGNGKEGYTTDIYWS